MYRLYHFISRSHATVSLQGESPYHNHRVILFNPSMHFYGNNFIVIQNDINELMVNKKATRYSIVYLRYQDRNITAIKLKYKKPLENREKGNEKLSNLKIKKIKNV